jgi:hypothetical protein
VGSISSTTSVNSTAGFSIAKYTGNGVASTVGHGLSSAPAFVIVRNYSISQNFIIGQKDSQIKEYDNMTKDLKKELRQTKTKTFLYKIT